MLPPSPGAPSPLQKPNMKHPPPPIAFVCVEFYQRFPLSLYHTNDYYLLFSSNISPFSPLPLPPTSSNLSIVCHHVMPLCLCHTVILICHCVIRLITKLIRYQLDNIYVNKLIMKQLSIHICKLIHNCKHWASAEYYITNIINKTNYILLQCKYDT